MAGTHENESLYRLISDAYDAALDPTRWTRVLERTAAFVGGSAASFFTRDVLNKTGNSDFNFGTEPRYNRLFANTYVKLDPLNTAYVFLNVGEVVSSSNIVPHDEFIETRFYQEWVRPQGLVDNVLALIDKTATSVAAFVVFRHERNGLTDDPARERMRLLVPHVRRAALIGKIVDLKTSEATTLSDALDQVAAGMILVDSQGRVVHANSAGLAILDDGDVLCLVADRLMAADQAADKAFAEIFASAGGGDAAIGTQGIALPLTARDGSRYLAHVLPLTSGARRQAGVGFSASMAVFVRRAQFDAPTMPEVIAKHYGLTPTELRVLLAVFESGGVADIAETLGISQATAKTHLRRLFDKTGTKRQADLVKLVAGFATPAR